MIQILLPEFLALSESDRCQYIKDYAILYAQQFSRKELDYYCRLADTCRALNKKPDGAAFMASLLPFRMALNFFAQPSSRTFMSFNAAQAVLGMRRMSLRDVRISSMSKGESLADSIRTFISYVDLVVIRHREDATCPTAFWVSMKAHRRLHFPSGDRPIPIVSGGSGQEQHPTQALLDIYTLEKSFDKVGGIDGKRLMLVGDLRRGRTVRSLSYLMKNYQGVSLCFAAPPEFQMKEDILQFLDRHGIPYSKVTSLDEGIRDADAVYMTRIQDDDQKDLPEGTHVATKQGFIFTRNHLRQLKPHACLLHPLPKRDEIEPELDYCGDPRVVYWRQERNGMWMRVALIAKLFQVDEQIMDRAAG